MLNRTHWVGRDPNAKEKSEDSRIVTDIWRTEDSEDEGDLTASSAQELGERRTIQANRRLAEKTRQNGRTQNWKQQTGKEHRRHRKKEEPTRKGTHWKRIEAHAHLATTRIESQFSLHTPAAGHKPDSRSPQTASRNTNRCFLEEAQGEPVIQIDGAGVFIPIGFFKERIGENEHASFRTCPRYYLWQEE